LKIKNPEPNGRIFDRDKPFRIAPMGVFSDSQTGSSTPNIVHYLLPDSLAKEGTSALLVLLATASPGWRLPGLPQGKNKSDPENLHDPIGQHRGLE
jgi:hypothetical protein